MKGFSRSRLEEKPFLVLWVFSALILCLGLVAFLIPERTLDISLGDTYYVIATSHLLIFAFIWFGLCGVGYYLLYLYKIKPVYWLTLLHFVLSIIMFIPIGFPAWFAGADHGFNASDIPEVIYFAKENGIKISSLMLLGSIQMLYMINIASSIIRKIGL